MGFTIEVGGNLTCNERGISKAPIFLSYSVTAGKSWNDITLLNTDSNGRYSAVWMPQATGNYVVKAFWEGNSSFPRTTNTVNLAMIPYEEENIFSVTSNSTISDLTFDTTSRRLGFTVTGEDNTIGYSKVTIAKILISDITKLKINIDDVEYNYVVTETEDSWILVFSYTHSTHNVIIDLQSAMVTGRRDIPLIYLIPVIAAIALVVGIAITRRMQSPKKTRLAVLPTPNRNVCTDQTLL